MSNLGVEALIPDVYTILNDLQQRIRELEALSMARDTVSLPIVASASGNTTLLAANSVNVIKVVSLSLLANADVNVKFRSGAATDITGLYYLPAKGGFVLPDHWDDCWFQTLVVTDGLIINLSGAVAVGGVLTYILG